MIENKGNLKPSEASKCKSDTQVPEKGRKSIVGDVKRQQRDNPLPRPQSVSSYIGFVSGFYKLCYAMRLHYTQLSLLMIIANGGNKGYTVSFLCDAMYYERSAAKTRSLFARLAVLKKRGLVLHVGNRYLVSELCWSIWGEYDKGKGVPLRSTNAENGKK